MRWYCEDENTKENLWEGDIFLDSEMPWYSGNFRSNSVVIGRHYATIVIKIDTWDESLRQMDMVRDIFLRGLTFDSCLCYVTDSIDALLGYGFAGNE